MTETAWAGAAYNLILYMPASDVLWLIRKFAIRQSLISIYAVTLAYKHEPSCALSCSLMNKSITYSLESLTNNLCYIYAMCTRSVSIAKCTYQSGLCNLRFPVAATVLHDSKYTGNKAIDDDEKVTMIDFPQMVSVSHRNAKMYFDRDVECIFKFFSKRFNISYQEDRDEEDGELAASGFTKRDQDEIEKFIEGGPEPKDGSSSDDESSGKEQTADEDNETVTTKMVALQLADQQVKSSCCNDEERVEENLDSCNVKVVRENEPTASGEQEDSNDLDNSDDDDDGSGDAELVKRLNKQRKRAVAAARGRRALASRNSYKDKGGKSSHNSKIQKQVSKW
uniref:non-specific serine/threonine protein kinase n=1 Tax=Ananas comosus var. bracteatus TaxID=296719 RepID=A0A6V7NGX3_ANACO|nr:unnamed protein product [Ananas comosus var. bracteatus]